MVVFVCFLRRVSASTPAFARLHLHRSGYVGHRLADVLLPLSSLADALPPFYSGGCFAVAVMLVGNHLGRMLCRHGLLVGCMLCHLCCAINLCTLYVVVFLSRFSCLVVARFVGSGESPPLLFLVFMFVARLSATCGVVFVSTLIASIY